MLDFNRLLVNILQSGDAEDPAFRATVYSRAEEAVLNIANKQQEPEKYAQLWIPLLHEEIDLIESRYKSAPTIEMNMSEPEIPFEIDTSIDTPPAPNPILQEQDIPPKQNNSAVGKLLAGLVVGLAVGGAGSYYYFGNTPQVNNTKSNVIELSVGDQFSSDALLHQTNDRLTLNDNSKAVAQFKRWGAKNVIAQISHNLSIKVAASEKSKNKPRFIIVFSGGGEKRVSYTFDMNLTAGTVTGTKLKDKASQTMLLEDGFWVFKQKLTPNPKHKNALLSIYPSFKGAKTGSITLKKLDLSLE